jgi:hypothetical protein
LLWFQYWHESNIDLSPLAFANTKAETLIQELPMARSVAEVISFRLNRAKDFGGDFSASELAELTPPRVAKVAEGFVEFLQSQKNKKRQ